MIYLIHLDNMAQGKAYTPEQKEQAIQSLQEYLKMGFSRNKACSLIGLPPATLSNWVSEDETLGMRLEGWENYITALAIANIKQAIDKESQLTDDTKKENSWKWAERKLKDLSPKNEVEHTVKELPTPLLNAIFDNNSNKEDSETIKED